MLQQQQQQRRSNSSSTGDRPELQVHEAIVGVCQPLKAKVGQVKVVDIATAGCIHASHGGTAIVILQTGAVVCDMDVDGVVWLGGQVQGLQNIHTYINDAAEASCRHHTRRQQ